MRTSTLHRGLRRASMRAWQAVQAALRRGSAASRVPGTAGPAPDPMPDLPGFRPGPMLRRSVPGLQYRLFVPRDARVPMPLVVMLHGCRQDAEDFARGTRMDAIASARGWCVLYPEQSQRANGMRCWNWFDPAAVAAEAQLLLGLVDTVSAEYPIDASRIHVAGLSAGAAMAVALAARHPDRFASVAAHSGLPYGAAHDVASAFDAMRTPRAASAPLAGRVPPLLVLHGEDDRVVAPGNADALVAQWLAAGRVEAALQTFERGATGGRGWQLERFTDHAGRVALERWRIDGAGHAWSGGDPGGSYADAAGPAASEILAEFFARHSNDGRVAAAATG